MAVKALHVVRSQELRFGDRATARDYLERYGGELENWRIVPVPRSSAMELTGRERRGD